MFRFEKLEVWQKAVDFAREIYELTTHFPNGERFGLLSQMRRAAVSVSSNIAEGTGRSSDKDFAHFIEIAYGSLLEVISQLQTAHQLAYVTRIKRDETYHQAEELARMLSGLKAALLDRST